MSTPHIRPSRHDATLVPFRTRAIALLLLPLIYIVSMFLIAISSIFITSQPLVFIGVGIVFFYLLNFYLIIVYGQSIGKKIMKIRVVDMYTRQPAGYCRALLIRELLASLVRNFTIVFFFFDYLRPLNDELMQCWHDRWAKTIVVKATKENMANVTTKRKIKGALLAVATVFIHLIIFALIFIISFPGSIS